MYADEDERSPEAKRLMFEHGFAKPGMRAFSKPAGERCPYQRHVKGCAVYDRRPLGCQVWNCRWLAGAGADTADLSRPDRVHYVIDVMPDYVTFEEEDGRTANVEAVQIWLDPDYPDAHRDPALRDYLERRGKEGIVALIRLNARDGFVLIPPAMTGGQWLEKHSGCVRTRADSADGYAADVFKGLATANHHVKFNGGDDGDNDH